MGHTVGHSPTTTKDKRFSEFWDAVVDRMWSMDRQVDDDHEAR